jgi:elongator complex protein 3
MNKVISELIKGLSKVKNSKDLDRLKKKVGKKYHLSKMILNATIYENLTKEQKKKYRKILQTKPTRSSSGICVVAVMSKPQKCPHGTCSYCPKGTNAPQSYTGKEPAARRAIRNEYDPFMQVTDRLNQLKATGHNPSKIELIIMGGTFPSFCLDYQEWFVTRCFQAMNVFGKKISKKQTSFFEYLEDVQKKNQTAEIRCIGITFETRPDWAKKEHINRMLRFGGTRVEIGVQSIYDFVLKKVKRGHTVSETIRATKDLKNAGFKVLYHIIPGLPGSSYKKDLEMFKELFSNPDFKPDMLKIYPLSVLAETDLFEMGYIPPREKETIKLLANMKKIVPKYIRIMRIQRDIPSTEIDFGIKKTNLRQLVKNYCKKHNIKCNCIRCRQAGIKKTKIENPVLSRLNYNASKGKEIFLSIEDKKNDILLGFLRMRIPENSFRPEINNDCSIIRELHVYGSQTPVGKKSKDIQHKGFGKKLLKKAESIAKNEFNKKRMAIISGVGVMEYYKKFGYKKIGPYMVKSL